MLPLGSCFQAKRATAISPQNYRMSLGVVQMASCAAMYILTPVLQRKVVSMSGLDQAVSISKCMSLRAIPAKEGARICCYNITRPLEQGTPPARSRRCCYYDRRFASRREISRGCQDTVYDIRQPATVDMRSWI